MDRLKGYMYMDVFKHGITVKGGITKNTNTPSGIALMIEIEVEGQGGIVLNQSQTQTLLKLITQVHEHVTGL